MKITWRGFADRHKIDYLLAILFGIYIAAVLWITLFSRLGTGYRGFLFPFQSYLEIANGNTKALVEDVENIILFVPLGIGLGFVKKWKLKNIAIIGLCTSLSIELLQAVFALGTFECDDLLHNTVGAIAGCLIISKVKNHLNMNLFLLIVCLLSMVLQFSIIIGWEFAQGQYMLELATLHDRADGSPNLLIYNGYQDWEKDYAIGVVYRKDGFLLISGSTNEWSWRPVSEIELQPGEYLFQCITRDLYDNEGGQCAVELDYYEGRICKTIRINTLDYFGWKRFRLDETTKVTVYVGLRNCNKSNYILAPVIYKE